MLNLWAKALIPFGKFWSTIYGLSIPDSGSCWGELDTPSATHIPTGLQVTARGRSQVSNKTTALQQLSAHLAHREREERLNAQNQMRQMQNGCGKRGDKIRTIRYQDGIVKCEVTGQKKSLAKYLAGDIAF